MEILHLFLQNSQPGINLRDLRGNFEEARRARLQRDGDFGRRQVAKRFRSGGWFEERAGTSSAIQGAHGLVA